MATVNGNHSLVPSLNPADFPPSETLSRDVCVIGGGGSGTYTAIQLQDLSKSVVVVEKRDRLGGHTETYTEPETGTNLNVGVIVFGHLPEVKEYLARFDIPLMTVPTSLGDPDYVDMATGNSVEGARPTKEAVEAALAKYESLIAAYPGLKDGFDLDYPVAPDLLLPFGEFVKKHSLEDLVREIFAHCHGSAPLMGVQTLYVFKYFNEDLINTLRKGFLMTARMNTGELYDKAKEHLGGDALLSSTVIAMDRSSSPVRLLVKTPSGNKLILAKKIVSTVPPKKNFLTGYDLFPNEEELFSKFFHSYYYTGIVRGTGLTTSKPVHAYHSDAPHGVSSQSGICIMNPVPGLGFLQVYYASKHEQTEEEVRTDVIGALRRMQKTRGVNPDEELEFVAFANHSPYNMMVGPDAIQDGFYERLSKLQGANHSFWNGAAFHAQDSSVLWRFTRKLLPSIVAALE